jgi:hypothetical protein
MSVIGWMIVVCEVAFWLFIILGLMTRYVFKFKTAGFILLAFTPVIDLILLMTTGIDLYNGATATIAHAIAAVYIGISLSYGKSMIEWADIRFQYYVMKQGEKPRKRFGLEHSKHYFSGWLKHLLAYAIGASLIILGIFLIQDPARTEALSGFLNTWSMVLAIDLVISISYFIWPRKEKVIVN